MAQKLFLILGMLVAVSSSAGPALLTFELSSASVQSAIAVTRAAQVKARAESLGPQIDALAQDLARSQSDASRLRSDMRILQSRLQRTDPAMRRDIEAFTRTTGQLVRDTQGRLGSLRFLSAQAVKNEILVAPATRLLDAALKLKSEADLFAAYARFASSDFMNAGYTLEGMDLDRNSHDIDLCAKDLHAESERMLSKVRGPILVERRELKRATANDA